MKRNIFICLVILVGILGCGKKQEMKTYYENGKLKEHYIFASKREFKSMRNYINSLYDESGQLIGSVIVEEGMRKVDYFFYKNGETSKVTHYKNNKKHGVETVFTLEGEVADETFYINGTPLIKMKAFNERDNDMFYYYYLEGDSLEHCGTLKFNTFGEVVENRSFYYFIDSKDTINNNEKFLLKFKTYTLGEKNIIDSILIGDFYERYSFSDDAEVMKIEGEGNNMVSYLVPTHKTGYNLIMGKIYISSVTEKEKLTREFIFYKSFFVN